MAIPDGARLRVAAGAFRGRRLGAPPGRATRPTTSKVRAAIFDLLGTLSADAAVLDLFAGSGALGIEALSRGAASAVFVERDRRALSALRRNLEALDLASRTQVIARDALRGAPWPGAPFALILADPPYGAVDLVHLAQAVLDTLAPGGVFVLESAAAEGVPELPGLALVKDRRYGDTQISLFSRALEESG